MYTIIEFIVAFFISFIVSLLVVFPIRKIAVKYGFIDMPNYRKVHKKPTPRLGGLAIFLGAFAGMLYLTPSHEYLFAILLGAIIILITGILDDKYAIRPILKLTGQVIPAIILIYSGLIIDRITLPVFGVVDLGYFSIVVTFFWIIGIINAINLIDGLDGLAAGVSTIALVSILTMALIDQVPLVIFICTVLIGANLGFLYHNFYPAKIYMGDTGSLFLGYMIAVISILGLFKNVTLFSFIIPVFVLAVPILDTLFAIIRRIKNKEKIMKPDKKHIHHQLLAAGFSHRGTVLIIYSFSAIFGVLAIVFSNAQLSVSLVITFILLLIMAIFAKFVGLQGFKEKQVLESTGEISNKKTIQTENTDTDKKSSGEKRNTMAEICVVGLGYIGLPTSGYFASKGFKVHGFDVNEKVIDTLSSGEIHIEEPNLPAMIKQVINNGNLQVSTEPVEADSYIIAVPTPIHDDETADLDYIEQAIKDIIPYLNKGNLIIVESTIPPRTIDDIIVPLLKEAGLQPEDNEIYVAHCPERVIPGKIMIELVENNRIVGGYTDEAAAKAGDLYRQVIEGNVFETTALVAEMSKLMENTYRDVNIALANELAKVSEEVGVNAYEVINLANMHPRVNIHQPGPGVGGHCIAVDPYFIIEKAKDRSPLMQTARQINNSMPCYVVEQVEKITKDVNDKVVVSVLGLAYKGDVDDTRESPAIKVVNELMSKGFTIKCHDPHVQEENVYVDLYSLEESLHGAHIALVLTDHRLYREMDHDLFKKLMKTPIVLDTRNVITNSSDIQLYSLGDLNKVKKSSSEQVDTKNKIKTKY